MTSTAHPPEKTKQPPVESATAHLSVIIPSCSNRKSFKDWVPSGSQLSRKALVERALNSVLKVLENESPQEIKVEILIGDDELDDRVSDHIETNFSYWITRKTLRIVRIEPRTGDPGTVKNTAASKSTGAYLHFLDPHDQWKSSFGDLLNQNSLSEDLIFSSSSRINPESDWIRKLLIQNTLVPSSIVIKRSLFEKAGGFPKGYGGLPFPKKPPGVDEFELLLMAMLAIEPSVRKKRIRITDSLICSDHELGPYQKHIRGFVSTAYLLRKLPRHYWPYVGKRFVNLLKSIN